MQKTHINLLGSVDLYGLKFVQTRSDLIRKGQQILKYILYQKHSCRACYSLFNVDPYGADLETKMLQNVLLL
ncbi:hypothetical protein C7Y70_03990 [Pseudoalteromonas sp. KS88]|nr:hypothetical protein C7Y70_03990 [Pseudoalteromonas sp. KS88]